MSQVIILGRQPAIGLAELESLYGSAVVLPIGAQAARVEIEQSQIQPNRLGGCIKIAKLLTVLETTDWKQLQTYLAQTLPHHLGYIPEGKIKLGVSTYGIDVSLPALNAGVLNVKKVITKHGRSTRIIANKQPALNTAQVLHGGLLSATGLELLFIADGTQTILAQTHWVQDIDAYRKRDHERPRRDARVGMLPPKLAQTIINLATASIEPQPSYKILDPFCGTGVILQEALLMGYGGLGSDIDQRMVDYSHQNLSWLLRKKLGITEPEEAHFRLKVADATTADWDDPAAIAAETYLGRPLSSMPTPGELQKIMFDCNTIHRKFLANVARQTKTGFRMCLAVPAWHTNNGYQHLKILASLEDLGYNRIKFDHSQNLDLIYRRPDQIVARELVVLERK
jgi:hypothetical protein